MILFLESENNMKFNSNIFTCDVKQYFDVAFIEYSEIINNIPYNNILDLIMLIQRTFSNNGKLLLFGNGGSAADSIHIASEFVNKMLKQRPALPAISLCTDISILTAIANDIDYSRVFSRQLEAIGDSNDLAIGISTSGSSPNILQAFKTCVSKNIKTVLFTGDENRIIEKNNIDLIISVKSEITARIQEFHKLYWHIICEIIENNIK